ncbi:MAG: hypothetical protein JW731_15450 [Bacteroidales bacterium]|nr:hypothetical protein [Bacteroidales bacterium]
MTDNNLILIIAGVVAFHFIIGFGWVFWKIFGRKKTKPVSQNAEEDS